MDVVSFARQVLMGGQFEDKLLPIDSVDRFNTPTDSFEIKSPGRPSRLEFSDVRVAFPKHNSFHEKQTRAKALHFFANHELLAIEIMALVLYRFPMEEKIQKAILKTMADEQKHLMLYIRRMQALGMEFGDLPLNDFFWKNALKLKNIEQYFALMALTFEAANLDFGLFYRDIFQKYDDTQSAQIMQIVHDDEISHVALGVSHLKKAAMDKPLWDYYCSLMPADVAPSRAKGMLFDRKGRESAGFPEDYINTIEHYRDNHPATNRKICNQQKPIK